jgi:hypothetical protein
MNGNGLYKISESQCRLQNIHRLFPPLENMTPIIRLLATKQARKAVIKIQQNETTMRR